MGTVKAISADTGRPMVLLDGDAEGGEVECLTACSYRPMVGDRAVLARVGGRWVAEYAIGTYRG